METITRKALATLVRRCKAFDKAKGFECDLTTDFIEGWLAATGWRCHYSGKHMTLPNRCKSLTAVSIDRVNNHQGHTKTNIVLCQQALNLGRNDAPYEDFKMYLASLGITPTTLAL